MFFKETIRTIEKIDPITMSVNNTDIKKLVNINKKLFNTTICKI